MVLLTASPDATVPYPRCKRVGPHLLGEAPREKGGWAWRTTRTGKAAMAKQRQDQRDHYCSVNLDPPKTKEGRGKPSRGERLTTYKISRRLDRTPVQEKYSALVDNLLRLGCAVTIWSDRAAQWKTRWIECIVLPQVRRQPQHCRDAAAHTQAPSQNIHTHTHLPSLSLEHSVIAVIFLSSLMAVITVHGPQTREEFIPPLPHKFSPVSKAELPMLALVCRYSRQVRELLLVWRLQPMLRPSSPLPVPLPANRSRQRWSSASSCVGGSRYPPSRPRWHARRRFRSRTATPKP